MKREIEMREVTEAGRCALLEYCYTSDIKQALIDSKSTMELFVATHAYGINPLEKRLKKLLKEKSIDFYGMGSALRLFRFGHEIECYKDMKTKVV